MAIHPEAVGASQDAGILTWTSTDALLYALGVGAGSRDPGEELAFTTENTRDRPQRVLPSFAVVIGHAQRPEGDDLFSRVGDFGLDRLLHGAQKVVLHDTLRPTGSLHAVRRIAGVYDKGRNALIETASDLRDPETGRLVVETSSSIVVRGEGGFGGPRGESVSWAEPTREPDATVDLPTRGDQALLYRLSGDRNPLHSDPSSARAAGLDAPILHGLCTYGFTCRALVQELCDGDVDRFGGMDGRFSAMVAPGDVLTVDLWRRDDGASFRTRVGDRVVLDRGVFTFRA